MRAGGHSGPGDRRTPRVRETAGVTEQTTAYDESQYDPHADPQWSEDGHYWWDGGKWITAAEREAELEQAAQEESARVEAARVEAEQARERRAHAAEEKAARVQAARAEAQARKDAAAAQREAERAASAEKRVTAAEVGAAAAQTAAPATRPETAPTAGPQRPQAATPTQRPQAEPVRPTTTLPAERSGLRTGTRVVLASLLLAVVLAGVIVALANRDTKPRTPAAPGGTIGSTLRDAGQAEQKYRDKHGGYTGSILDLTPLGFRPAKGVTLTVLHADAGAYCLNASKGTESYYFSSAQLVVTRTPCS